MLSSVPADFVGPLSFATAHFTCARSSAYMSDSGQDFEWVFASSRERLLAELESRNLPMDGSTSMLALRLLLQVSASQGRRDESGGGTVMSDNENLRLPSGGETRPDSPFDEMAGARTRIRPADTPRSGSSGGVAATAMCNIMRKWNLKFSRASGEDAEMFLLRIEEGRELVPVNEEDILRCLRSFWKESPSIGSGRGEAGSRRGLPSRPRGARDLATLTSSSRLGTR